MPPDPDDHEIERILALHTMFVPSHGRRVWEALGLPDAARLSVIDALCNDRLEQAHALMASALHADGGRWRFDQLCWRVDPHPCWVELRRHPGRGCLRVEAHRPAACLLLAAVAARRVPAFKGRIAAEMAVDLATFERLEPPAPSAAGPLGLEALIREAAARYTALTDAERAAHDAAQRASWVRGMTARCEHGVLDFEQCGQCRAAARRAILDDTPEDTR